MMKKISDILYLSYDGMTDALGESQVLSYVIGLSNLGHRITLISFEKKEAFKKKGGRIKELCIAANIIWIPLSYTSRPPVLSTLFDIMKLQRVVSKFKNHDIIHCRGYITSIVGLFFKKKYSTKFIFDMRGFWADEKLESGHWAGMLYRPIYNFFKKKENEFFKNADVVVSLTEAGKREIVSISNIDENRIKTIPTCVNQKLFKIFDPSVKKNMKAKLAIQPSEKVLLYSGSLGGNYDIRILIEAFEAFLKQYPNSKLLVLTKTLEDRFPELSSEISNRIIIKSVEYKDVADYLMVADLGFVFYKAGFSNIGRYPTKLAEYWSCGLPCLVFNKIGDTQKLLDDYPEFGFYYFNKSELEGKLNSYDLEVDKIKMRDYSKQLFSLEKGVSFYDHIYTDIMKNERQRG